ncbi:MAG: hypothetical protein ACKO40_00700 [Planctomycetaceae bacterium]
MKSSASFRSVAIRVTGVCAALAISFLAGSARAEALSQHLLASGPQGAAGSSLSGLDSATPSMASASAPVSAAARAVLQAPAYQGYAAAPAKTVFSESILVNPSFTMTLSLAKPAGQSQLTGVVRTKLLQ